ncbi:hypothetical protein [Bacillus sp. NPDC093026]|uniref:hypothetical protein n=1 Tax=Bacillus sp. NPDC093026 TaxID=3363948 RepID=UPI003801745E
MGKLQTEMIKVWLSIPRWFRMFILTAVTIYVLWTLLVNGVKNIFHMDTQSLMISLISSAIILFIFNQTNKHHHGKGKSNIK